MFHCKTGTSLNLSVVATILYGRTGPPSAATIMEARKGMWRPGMPLVDVSRVQSLVAADDGDCDPEAFRLVYEPAVSSDNTWGSSANYSRRGRLGGEQ